MGKFRIPKIENSDLLLRQVTPKDWNVHLDETAYAKYGLNYADHHAVGWGSRPELALKDWHKQFREVFKYRKRKARRNRKAGY